MLLKLSTPSLVLIVMCLISSCKKEGRANGNSPASDSTLLTKYIILDTTRASGQDTIGTNLFYYDSQSRLIKFLHIYNLFGPPQAISEIVFEYTGNDQYPGRCVYRYWPTFTDYPNGYVSNNDTLYWFYSGNKVAKDSFVSQFNYPTSIVTEFKQITPTYFQNIKRETNRVTGFAQPTGTNGVSFTMQNADYVEVRDTTGNFNAPVPHRQILLFDNLINPFKKISIPYPFPCTFPFNSHLPNFIPEFLANMNNNNTSSTTTYYGLGGTTVIQSAMGFNYSNINLPISSRYIGVPSNKFIYIYGQ
jgi:hypothetical protein